MQGQAKSSLLSAASSRSSGGLMLQPWLTQATWLYSFIWFSHFLGRPSKTDWGTLKHHISTCRVPYLSNTVTFDFTNWNRVSGVGGGVCMVLFHLWEFRYTWFCFVIWTVTPPLIICKQRVKGGTHSAIIWCYTWLPLLENTLSFNFRCNGNMWKQKRHREKRC